MAEGKKLGGAGLRGQVAGKTALSTVGKSGSGLTYRGYDVKDLAENCEFESIGSVEGRHNTRRAATGEPLIRRRRLFSQAPPQVGALLYKTVGCTGRFEHQNFRVHLGGARGSTGGGGGGQ